MDIFLKNQQIVVIKCSLFSTTIIIVQSFFALEIDIRILFTKTINSLKKGGVTTIYTNDSY
jgi:hypothetical protein